MAAATIGMQPHSVWVVLTDKMLALLMDVIERLHWQRSPTT
jgi:hypothetical protein